MSQASKRPGARDISDLKARLGLKKPAGEAPAGAVPPPGGAVPPPAGAVPPPAGIPSPSSSGSAIPAPPGVQPPPGIVAPPGMAQPAPAAPRVAAPAPDIVVVNDGSPVESVASKNKARSLGKTAALVLAPLIAGVIIGKVGQNAAHFNQVIEDAQPIHDDVKKVRRGLAEIQGVLEGAKAGESFKPNDPKITKALSEIAALEGDTELVFSSSMYHLDPAAAGELFLFYSDIAKVNQLIKNHVRRSRSEEKILDKAKAKLETFNPINYGAVIKADEGGPVSMEMVQLGLPLCEGQSKPNPAECEQGKKPFVKVAQRADETGAWKISPIAVAGEGGVPPDTVVRLKFTPSVQQLAQGGPATVAKAAYEERLTELSLLTDAMLDSGKKLEKLLNEKANSSKKFSFGM